jgi:hypothetical protein
MEFHELQKTRVADLREMMKEHLPEVTGVIGLKKEELVDHLADKLGIEKPHKHVAAGLGKRAIKAEIKELKVKRQAALEARDSDELKKYRRKIHRRKRRLRRMMNLSSSFDHRFVDGYDAAELIQALKGLLEQPALIFMPD